MEFGPSLARRAPRTIKLGRKGGFDFKNTLPLPLLFFILITRMVLIK
jgi:hypothetical protein